MKSKKNNDLQLNIFLFKMTLTKNVYNTTILPSIKFNMTRLKLYSVDIYMALQILSAVSGKSGLLRALTHIHVCFTMQDVK